MLKVALINNMNNNFFSLARFLRDKNIDAHLFQVDSLDNHFLPTCDTFDPNLDYIHLVANISFRDFYKIPFSYRKRRELENLKKILNEFDIVIACGGLAILEWAGIKVDIFVPHGGDLYQSPFMFDYCIKKHFPYSLLMKRYIKYQRKAIANARAIIALASIDRHMYDALIKLNHKWIDLGIPMVYPIEQSNSGKWDLLDSHDFVFFSHARQGWKTALDYKGNDKAIRAFADFIKTQKKYLSPIMVLFDYGPDVDASKELIDQLNIKPNVIWVPKMERKYIYEGIKKATLVFDYFHDEVVSFGGVTFEAFSCSVPVIGNKNLKNITVSNSIPLVQAFSQADIKSVLDDYVQNTCKYKEQGKQVKKWFDEQVGVGLVDKYIELIEYLAKNKNISLNDKEFNLPTVQNYVGPMNIQ